MNKDGSYTPREAARNVAKFKSLLGPPYRILGHVESGRVAQVPPEQFLAQFREIPPGIAGQGFENLTQMLEVVRTLYPTGDWLLLITGVTLTNFKKPVAFVDTGIVEKAIKWHTSQGHGGTI